MNKHTVFVAGKRFVLLSEDKNEYVENLAKEVGDNIARLAAENPSIDRRAAAILCALDYADDREKEIEKNARLSEKAQPLLAQADRQAKQLKELKDKLLEKDNEIKALKEEISKLKTSANQAHKDDKHRKKHGQNNQHPQKPFIPLADKPVQPPVKGYTPTRQFSLFDDEK